MARARLITNKDSIAICTGWLRILKIRKRYWNVCCTVIRLLKVRECSKWELLLIVMRRVILIRVVATKTLRLKRIRFNEIGWSVILEIVTIGLAQRWTYKAGLCRSALRLRTAVHHTEVVRLSHLLTSHLLTKSNLILAKRELLTLALAIELILMTDLLSLR